MASIMAAPATDPLLDVTVALNQFVVAAEHLKLKQVDRFCTWARDLASRLQAEHANVPRVKEVVERLQAFALELSKSGPNSPRLRAIWRDIGNDYEALFAYVRRTHSAASERLTHIKPKNIWRNLFHVSTGVLAVSLYELVWDRTGMLILGASVLATFLGLDALRRLWPHTNGLLVGRLFGHISRPAEAYKLPSATWYMGALLLGVVLFPKHAIEVGTLVLAFGDPVAALVGKTWGTRKLFRDKSVNGTLAFMGAAALVVTGFLLMVGYAPLAALGIGLGAASAGAVAELFSHRVDDNFSIPLFAGGIAALLLGM